MRKISIFSSTRLVDSPENEGILRKPRNEGSGGHTDRMLESIDNPPTHLDSWALHPGFVISFSLHLKLIYKPIVLDFGDDLA